MVSRTLKLKDLIDWHMRFDVIDDKGELLAYYLDTNTLVKIKLDSTSLAALKQKRDQILSFLEQSITLSGEVVEKYEKQSLTRTETVEQWERVL